jgi:superfamily II DNA/RNA helicase
MIDELVSKALKDPYLEELLTKLEKINAFNFFKLSNQESLSEKEYNDLLRFADILSYSYDGEPRNKAYKIISLLFEFSKQDKFYKISSTAILSKLGNFPGLSLFEKKYEIKENLPFARELEKAIKQELQKVPDKDLVFTDSQYIIFQKLKNSNQYSFSGPTSLGKSFIIDAFIKYILKEGSRENIVIMVPTKALINQVSNKLMKEIDNSDYRILTYPAVPQYIRSKKKFIFIFTPERLISYLSNDLNPRIGYLFVDEAHKLVSDNDSRNPLYYHAVLQAERKSIKLFFCSPNIPNPDIFLDLFEKDKSTSLSTNESPVSQNRFFIDMSQRQAFLINESSQLTELPYSFTHKNFMDVINDLGKNKSNIVYTNSREDAINFAVEFAKGLPEIDDDEIDKAIKSIAKHLHKQYYLIDCLKKGVAFHFGSLPQTIRRKIEELFEKEIISFIFCTSTLVEGVNLPAKNIFILNNRIGLSKFTGIDFWNLAGRAGRLTKELSGNVICMRINDKSSSWKDLDKDLLVVKNKKVENQISPIDKSKKSIFKKMGESLNNEEFSKKNPTATEKELWDSYANIALIHKKRNEQSLLLANFTEKNPDASKILEHKSKQITIPERILSESPAIKAIYQQKILDHKNPSELVLPEDFSYTSILSQLENLSKLYNWSEEESKGRNPLMKGNILGYYAYLMSEWMASKPIGQMIMASIEWHNTKKIIYINNTMLPFNSRDPYHINVVVNDLITKIDKILRFKLQKYFENYYSILEYRLGKGKAGANWGNYLEYGTTSKEIIEIQNIGIPRHIAKYILDKVPDAIRYEDDGSFSGIDFNKVLEELDPMIVEYDEIMDISKWASD